MRRKKTEGKSGKRAGGRGSDRDDSRQGEGDGGGVTGRSAGKVKMDNSLEITATYFFFINILIFSNYTEISYDLTSIIKKKIKEPTCPLLPLEVDLGTAQVCHVTQIDFSDFITNH